MLPLWRVRLDLVLNVLPQHLNISSNMRSDHPLAPGQVVITDGGKTTASQGLAGMAAYVTGPAGDQYITG